MRVFACLESNDVDIVILKYFNELFSDLVQRESVGFLELLTGIAAMDINQDLSKPYSSEEVKEALQ